MFRTIGTAASLTLLLGAADPVRADFLKHLRESVELSGQGTAEDVPGTAPADGAAAPSNAAEDPGEGAGQAKGKPKAPARTTAGDSRGGGQGRGAVKSGK